MIYFVAALILASGWFLPWWWSALLTGFIGYKAERGLVAFRQAFIATAVCWIIIGYFLDSKAHGLVTARLSKMFFIPYPFLFLLLVGLIGGIFSGLTSLFVYKLRIALKGTTNG